jgi:hypothetical protein
VFVRAFAARAPTTAAGADASMSEADALAWHANRVRVVLAGAPALQARHTAAVFPAHRPLTAH